MVQAARKYSEVSTCSSSLQHTLLKPRGKTGPSPQGYLRLLRIQSTLRTRDLFHVLGLGCDEVPWVLNSDPGMQHN